MVYNNLYELKDHFSNLRQKVGKNLHLKKINYQYIKKHKSNILICIVALFAIIFGAHYILGLIYPAKDHSKALPVVVASVKTMNVPVYISALGTVTSLDTVTIKTQVNGQLIKLNFKDGQKVNTGDVLAELDKRPYQADLEQAQGQLERDTALLQNAKIDLERYANLWKQNSVSKQVLDTQKALVAQYEGTVKLDKGLVESAKINVEYCNILSPITGRVGIALVDEGNIVQTTDSTGIVILNTVNPITVLFSISERDLYKVLKKYNTLTSLVVEAYDRDGSNLLARGNLIALDNQIDLTTGMVKLEANFNNDDMMLFPNQFVNINLLVDTLPNALVVPTPAVQNGPRGNFVYLLDKENKVTITKVATGISNGGSTVVTSGLAENDVVVIEGVDKLIDGAKVYIPNNAVTKENK